MVREGSPPGQSLTSSARPGSALYDLCRHRTFPETTALRALQMMDDGGYRHLPVLDRGQVVGVVSRRDFFGEEKARLDRERHLWEVMG